MWLSGVPMFRHRFMPLADRTDSIRGESWRVQAPYEPWGSNAARKTKLRLQELDSKVEIPLIPF